jgi:hypothetical protein
MRHYYTSRNMTPIVQGRSRIASLIDREPVTVTVQRYPTSGGVTGPKNLQPVGSFIGRIEESQRGQIVTTDAYSVLPVEWLLITLRGNDHVDGVSGSTVDIKTNDRVTITDEIGLVGVYVVGAVKPTRSHLEITLQERA